MNRRSFFVKVSVLASTLGLYKSYPVYTYDWPKQWTDDPRLKGKRLPFGRYTDDGKPRHTVTVDGKDFSNHRIYRLRTGRSGYVEFRPEGSPPTEILDTYTGKVWSTLDHDCPHMQTYRAGDYPHKLRYIERLVIRCAEGLVEYTYKS